MDTDKHESGKGMGGRGMGTNAEDVKTRTRCRHLNEILMRETQELGTVVCLDCGRERDWNAY